MINANNNKHIQVRKKLSDVHMSIFYFRVEWYYRRWKSFPASDNSEPQTGLFREVKR